MEEAGPKDSFISIAKVVKKLLGRKALGVGEIYSKMLRLSCCSAAGDSTCGVADRGGGSLF